MTVNENIKFSGFASRIRLPDCSKLAVNPKNDNDVAICWYDGIFKLFWILFVSLVKFSYWSKFHVNIATGSGVMTIYFYKGLTRNPEIGNTPVWVLPDIWRLGEFRHTKFRTDVSNQMLLNATKYHDYSFYRFWVIKGTPTGGGKIIHPTPLPQIRFKDQSFCFKLAFNKSLFFRKEKDMAESCLQEF